jgi:hypothetical protein
LLITSINSSLKKRRPDIERVHEKEAMARIKQDTELYIEFERDYFDHLNDGYATCQILKEFDLTDVANSNYTEEATKRAERTCGSMQSI